MRYSAVFHRFSLLIALFLARCRYATALKTIDELTVEKSKNSTELLKLQVRLLAFVLARWGLTAVTGAERKL